MSIMKYVTLPETIYIDLVDAARKHMEDIESGVDDGMYDDTPENAEEIAAIRAAIDYQPTYDEVSDPPEAQFLVKVDHQRGVAQMSISEIKNMYTDEGLEYTNHYKCEACDNEWTDTHSCACDDECSECGKAYSPFDYETNEDDADRDLTLYEWLDTCEVGDEYDCEEHDTSFERIK